MKLIFTESQLKLQEQKYTKSSTFSNYPQSGTKAAQKALKYKEDYGDEVKGGTQIGWTRARQLADRKPLSYDTVKRIAAFERHRKNSKIDSKHKNEPWKDNGHVAWLLWGGSSMINWAKKIVNKIEKDES